MRIIKARGSISGFESHTARMATSSDLGDVRAVDDNG
jgi:hypothetical protein